MMKGVFLLLSLLASVSVSESQPVSLLPHAHESFNISHTQVGTVLLTNTLRRMSPSNPEPQYQYRRMKNAGSCSYLAVITTSCSSPRYTRDQISIAFGDAYGNQIYAPRLDDPSSGTCTFESCSSDTFQIYGPCAYQICYLYLYRSELDGWKLESVKISGYNGRPLTFDYKTSIPSDAWYGFNLCNDVDAASPYYVIAL